MSNPIHLRHRMNHLARASTLAVALLAVVAASIQVPAARATGAGVAATQRLIVLKHDHAVRARPFGRARTIEWVDDRRPLTGVPTVLPLLGRALTTGGQSWLHVRLPGRPNGHAGWIRAHRTRGTSTPWRLSVDLSDRRVTVHQYGRVVRRFSAVVGKPSTPTPTGRFFIEEALDISSQVGGPFAMATSARSNVLQEFEGGPGQIALHGTNGLSGAPGTAASHGCIRLSTGSITWLVTHVGRGVPLTIVR
jgi:lipoprotein-anchoring transpeptidase ErfK/SrfK